MTTQSFSFNPAQARAQKLLAGQQRHTLLVGGSRSGKTFLLVRAVLVRALKAENSRHAILRLHGNAVRASVWLDTLPTVLRTCWPEIVPHVKEHRQDGFFELPNGSQIWLGGLDDKDRAEKILGQEYATIYLNECSQIPYNSALLALTRLAQQTGLRNKAYYDLNPAGTGHWTYRLFIEGKEPQSMEALGDADNYAHAFLNPADNAENLDEEYLRSLRNLPERQRRRFYEGAYLAEIEGALWTIDSIERGRVGQDEVKSRHMRRIVVAVDPSGAQGDEDKRSDEIGLVVCGIGYDGHGYVFADRTIRAGPAQWGRAAVQAYHDFGADKIVAEKNFGGGMVEHVIKTTDRRVPVRMLTASRGKAVRAEPVAALYEVTEDHPSRVHHVGRFPELEDQMCNFATSGYQGDRSPDRADALVWGLSELMLGGKRAGAL